jgi:hypothetical protein
MSNEDLLNPSNESNMMDKSTFAALMGSIRARDNDPDGNDGPTMNLLLHGAKH